MDQEKIHIKRVYNHKQVPYQLLELADPSRAQIDSYLSSGICHIAQKDTTTIGALVLKEVTSDTIEIKNIAVSELHQGKGIGKLLIRHAEKVSCESGYQTLQIGTGNSSIGQLALYQKMGFEINRIDKNFFADHYDEPIFENGIQCKHMIILNKELINT